MITQVKTDNMTTQMINKIKEPYENQVDTPDESAR
jgi:hypothetical protein